MGLDDEIDRLSNIGLNRVIEVLDEVFSEENPLDNRVYQARTGKKLMYTMTYSTFFPIIESLEEVQVLVYDGDTGMMKYNPHRIKRE